MGNMTLMYGLVGLLMVQRASLKEALTSDFLESSIRVAPKSTKKGFEDNDRTLNLHEISLSKRGRTERQMIMYQVSNWDP